MANFVLNPETGEVSVEKTEYVKVELAELENEQNAAQAEFDQGAQRVQELQDQLNAEQEAQGSREARLNEAKSSLDAYQAVAPQPEPEPAAEGTGSEDQVGAEAGDDEAAGENAAAEGADGEPVAVNVEETPQF